MLRSIPVMPKDWVHFAELSGGMGSVLNDFTRIEFPLCPPAADALRIGPYAKAEEAKETIFKERQFAERIVTFYCILIECDHIW